jgi:3-oxoacyl-[acyl-carrier-protein] synthase II
MLSPVGNTVESTWKALLAGQSGISLIDHFDTSAYATKFAGLVKDFNCEDIISRKEQRKMDDFIQYGIVAGVQAMQDSGLEVTEENATRIGAAIGSGIGGLGLIEENHSSLVNGGPRKISPFFVPSTIVNMVAGHLTIMFGLRGPSISIATACTSGVHNIGHAARMIAYGDADAMLAGGAKKRVPRWAWVALVRHVRFLHATIILRRRAVRGIRTVMVLFWAMAQALSCLKSMSTRKNAVRKFMRKSLVSA